MEEYIYIAISILAVAFMGVLLGSVLEKKKTVKKQLHLNEKIDKIISANKCIDKREWINWLQKRRK